MICLETKRSTICTEEPLHYMTPLCNMIQNHLSFAKPPTPGEALTRQRAEVFGTRRSTLDADCLGVNAALDVKDSSIGMMEPHHFHHNSIPIALYPTKCLTCCKNFRWKSVYFHLPVHVIDQKTQIIESGNFPWFFHDPFALFLGPLHALLTVTCHQRCKDIRTLAVWAICSNVHSTMC
ncbi:hypothetical protein TNCV_2674441 [Trichonephila clavipes]|nr:hypothetical protein TNCV_2674441 [Trichonephila clavipes]